MDPNLPQATARHISHPVHMCTEYGQITSVRQIELSHYDLLVPGVLVKWY